MYTYLIGDSPLLFYLVSLLKKHVGFFIAGIATNNPELVEFSREENIKLLVVKDIYSEIEKNRVDILFTADTSTIIPGHLLKKIKLIALNFHNSLLPTYAGVNATSWALLNNESFFGCTIHILRALIDGGEIIAQSKFRINKSHTAFSLNLKCVEEAKVLFASIIDKLAMGLIPQPIIKPTGIRSYYSKSDRPMSFGYLDFSQPALKIMRQVNAFYTRANFVTDFCLPKIMINEKIFIINDIYLSRRRANKQSKLTFEKGQLIIPCQNGEFRLNYLLDVFGERINDDMLQGLVQAHLTPAPIRKKLDILINSSEKISIKSYLSDEKKLIELYNLNPAKKNQSHLIENRKPLAITVFLKKISADDLQGMVALTYGVLSNITNYNVKNIFIVTTANKQEKFLINIQLKCISFLENNSSQSINELLKSASFNTSFKKTFDITIDFFAKYNFRDLLSNSVFILDKILAKQVIIPGKFLIDINQEFSLLLNSSWASLFNENNVQYYFDTLLELLDHPINQIDFFTLQNKKFVIKNASALEKNSKEPNSINKKKRIIKTQSKITQEHLYNKTVQQLFEEQVAKTPNNIALLCDNGEITYSELNNQANQLAHYLMSQHQIKSDDLISVCLDRSQYTLISILAILKAGAAYVPIDTNYPDARITYILSDTKSKILLTNNIHKNRLKHKNTHLNICTLTIDSKEIQAKLADQDTANPITKTLCSHLIYVIYTSGTEGKPKGVMTEHKNVASLVKEVDYFNANEFDTFALFSDIAFDAATFEIWGALLNGAKLFIPTNRLELLSNPDKFQEALKKNNITILWLTKTLFDQLFHLNDSMFGGLNYLLVGGEALNRQLMYKLSASPYKPLHLINGYGPTENTTFSCTYEIYSDNIQHLTSVPIGAPLQNRTAYILNERLQLVPIGSIGELYVGGAGLTRGYLNRSDLTKARFISNPFQTVEEKIKNMNAQLYKTGDLVQMRPDGNLNYLGRNDFQVKIRGYRIELGEIENKLIAYPKIQQALVLAKEYTNSNSEGLKEKYLIAYYVSTTKINETTLRDYLATCLPVYMLPRIFAHLERLPQTTAGKVDIQALPDPTFVSIYNYVAPKNEQEQLICDAFAKALNLRKAGINDDFFNMGGDSIKVISLVADLKVNFKISVTDIFTLKTPKKIAKKIIFVKNNLKQQLDKVKLAFQFLGNSDIFNKQSDNKVASYLATLKKLPAHYKKKPINTILLTGATGYLGCNLLNQLLTLTDYKIYLIVRADTSKKAFNRVARKFQFYFDQTLDHVYNSRLFVFSGDIEKINLGLSKDHYQTLIAKIDSIIHPAALTKHYGEYDTFYLTNVQATINLLELSKLTKLKDFHYISTRSVLTRCSTSPKLSIFTEDDLVDNVKRQQNFYIKTKSIGEQEVINYQQQGVNANIYRVGNLAFISTNYRVQENIEENAFFSRLKFLVNFNITAREIGTEEISPVDLTAQAIIKLFDKKELINGIYHVFNPNLCNVIDIFTQNDGILLNVLPIHDFIDTIAKELDKQNAQHKLIIRFLLHQGWLDEGSTPSASVNEILQDRTNTILKSLNFQWPSIKKEMFRELIEKAYL